MGNLSIYNKKTKITGNLDSYYFEMFLNQNPDADICNSNAKKEMIPLLNRRLALPFYIPVVTVFLVY